MEALRGNMVSPATIREQNKKTYVHIEDGEITLYSAKIPICLRRRHQFASKLGRRVRKRFILVAIAVDVGGFFQWLKSCGLDNVKLIVGGNA